MVQYPTAEFTPNRNREGMTGQMNPMVDWSNEVRPTGQGQSDSRMRPADAWQDGTTMQARPQLNMQNTVSDDTIEMPLSTSEAYLGSLKNMLLRNRGNYIVATFLIGTQSTVSFEGVLYEVGNDFITIYQEGRDRYIVVDMYSLKYMEFYDTRQERLCRAMLQQDGTWQTR